MNITNKQIAGLKSIKLDGNLGGVYFLFNNDEMVYIGKGWNCLLRVAEHTRKDSDKVFDSWNYIEIDDSATRGKGERELINKYKPMYNKTYKNQ